MNPFPSSNYTNKGDMFVTLPGYRRPSSFPLPNPSLLKPPLTSTPSSYIPSFVSDERSQISMIALFTLLILAWKKIKSEISMIFLSPSILPLRARERSQISMIALYSADFSVEKDRVRYL